MIPRFRVCDSCARKGKEVRVGTSDAPAVQVQIAMFEDGGLSYDARLPRWAWRLWTRFNDRQKSIDDGADGELEMVPLKHELCVDCASALLTSVDAHEVISQREFRDERRADRAKDRLAELEAELVARRGGPS